jgi:response regulator RpfG family c-di-GMP phosphodiesterase
LVLQDFEAQLFSTTVELEMVFGLENIGLPRGEMEARIQTYLKWVGLEKMRQRGIQTPVVIITAFGDIPHAVRAMKLGAIDFLEKPLTPEMLRSTVAEVLRRHEAPSPLRANPQTFDELVEAAKRSLNLREFSEARKYIARALEIRSDSPEVFNLGGVLFEMLEDYDRAKRYYGQAIRLQRNYEPAQQNMRRIYELFQFGSSQEPFNLGDD